VWKPLEVRWYKTLGWWDELPIAKFSSGSMYWAFWNLKLSVIWVVSNKGKNTHKMMREIKW
jgi:hypothetical protein